MRTLYGYLSVDQDEGRGVRVEARLDDDSIFLSAPGTDLGGWTRFGWETDQTSHDRLRLTLAGEAFIFALDDPMVVTGPERPAPSSADGPEPDADPFDRPIEAEPAKRSSESYIARALEPLRRSSEDHDHSFDDHEVPGGLVRSICTECGHVSIDLTKVESDVDPPESRKRTSLFVAQRPQTGFVRLGSGDSRPLVEVEE